MEFVRVGKNYMIKNSNGRIVSEKEMLQLQNKELIIKDIEGCNCQKETTKKISKNKKRIKEIEKEENKTVEIVEEIKNIALNKEVQDDIIKKTDTTI